MNNETNKKEDAYKDWLEMIKESWTYSKLTDEERKWFSELFSTARIASGSPIRGSYNQRWNILNWMYHAFLSGLGYNQNPANWRDEESAT